MGTRPYVRTSSFRILGKHQEEIGGLWVPSHFEAKINASDCPYVVTVEIKIEAGQGPRCVVLTCTSRDGSPVTSEGLRRVKVASFIAIAIEKMVTVVDKKGVHRSLAGRALHDARARVLPRPARGRVSGDRLKKIADVYRSAAAIRRDPAQAVAEAENLANSSARRLVMQARKAGYLEPAPGPGRAGSVPRRKRAKK